MITHYTLLSCPFYQYPDADSMHRIMRGLRLTHERAIELARKWNDENKTNRHPTKYYVCPSTDYCADVDERGQITTHVY